MDEKEESSRSLIGYQAIPKPRETPKCPSCEGVMAFDEKSNSLVCTSCREGRIKVSSSPETRGNPSSRAYHPNFQKVGLGLDNPAFSLEE